MDTQPSDHAFKTLLTRALVTMDTVTKDIRARVNALQELRAREARTMVPLESQFFQPDIAFVERDIDIMEGPKFIEWGEQLLEIWNVKELTGTQRVQYAYAMFGLDEQQNFDYATLEERRQFHDETIRGVLMFACKYYMVFNPASKSLTDLEKQRLTSFYAHNPPMQEVSNKLDFFRQDLVKVIQMGMYTLCKVLNDLHDAHRAAISNMASELPPVEPLRQFMAGADDGSDSDFKDMHRLMTFVLLQLSRYQYKRFEDQCFTQIFTDTTPAHPTRCWRKVCTIEKFVHRACRKEDNLDMWMILLSSRDYASRITQRLMLGEEREFPELIINRHMFAYRNGIFDISGQPRFYRYGETEDLGPNEACVNYFNYDFEEMALRTPNPMDIPTPKLDSVFLYQLEVQFDEFKHDPELWQAKQHEVLRWIYVHMGRMMYRLHEYDDWQVVQFFKGQAGTGKSMLGLLFEYIFPGHLIGNLSSNSETQFGLMGLFNKLIWLATEVKVGFKLPLCELQQMISGETVSVAVKNKTPEMVKWKIPGLMCGNEIPAWRDVAGALLRRFVMVLFPRIVPQDMVNTNLHNEIQAEIGTVLPKLVLTYRLMVAGQNRRLDVWKMMPPYFHATRKHFLSSVDHLSAYLGEMTTYTFDPRCMVPMDHFWASYRTWLTEKRGSQNNVQCTEDYWGNSFHTAKLHVERLEAPWINNELVGGQWIIGLCSTECVTYYQPAPQ